MVGIDPYVVSVYVHEASVKDLVVEASEMCDLNHDRQLLPQHLFGSS